MFLLIDRARSPILASTEDFSCYVPAAGLVTIPLAASSRAWSTKAPDFFKCVDAGN